ncbi:MAG TPA: hypothetical protein VMH84_00070 [Xanthobacteraceae bacterium]|nr:hypothetical protein [Xanthobacteraceae bacterium]
MTNYTLPRADRGTHLKIIAISLIAGFLVVSVGFAARGPVSNDLAHSDNGIALKASQPTSWSSRETATVR